MWDLNSLNAVVIVLHFSKHCFWHKLFLMIFDPKKTYIYALRMDTPHLKRSFCLLHVLWIQFDVISHFKDDFNYLLKQKTFYALIWNSFQRQAGLHCDHGSKVIWLQTPFTTQVTPTKLFHILELPFLHQYNGTNYTYLFIILEVWTMTALCIR